MSGIKIPILFTGSKGETSLYTQFEPDVHLSYVDQVYLDKLEIPTKLRHVKKIATAVKGLHILINETVRLNFYIKDVLLSDDFLVVPTLSEEAIIGSTTILKWRIKLDFVHNSVRVDPTKVTMQLKSSNVLEE